jgi:hypothetical protein
MLINAWSPTAASQVNLAVTSTTGRVQQIGVGTYWRIFNQGPYTIFYSIGTVAINAVVTTSDPLPPGAIEYIMPGTATYIAAITQNSGETATLRVSTGYGI